MLHSADDGTVARFSFSFVLVGGPVGALVDPDSGVVNWTPGANDRGTRAFELRAYDERGGFGRQGWTVEVDGSVVAEVGPGAILGERAVLEGGRRTSTLRTLTKSTVAVARSSQIDAGALVEVSTGHRREDERDREAE